MEIKKFINKLFTKKRSCYNCYGFVSCFPDGFHGGYDESYVEKCTNYKKINLI